MRSASTSFDSASTTIGCADETCRTGARGNLEALFRAFKSSAQVPDGEAPDIGRDPSERLREDGESPLKLFSARYDVVA